MAPKEMLASMAAACGGFSQVPDSALAMIVEGQENNQGHDREELIRGLALAVEERWTDERTGEVLDGADAATVERAIRTALQ